MADIGARTRYRIGEGVPNPGAEIPGSGQATYIGNANLYPGTEVFDQNYVKPADFAIGKVQLTADFSTGTISGKIDDFLSPSDQAIQGSISISNGVITNVDQQAFPNRDDSIDADLSGNIDLNGVNTGVAGTMSGSFREETPVNLPSGPGFLNGNITLNTQETVPWLIWGGFYTEKQ